LIEINILEQGVPSIAPSALEQGHLQRSEYVNR
jgi:hypothetical protein